MADILNLLKENSKHGSSEFGTVVFLYALAISIRATTIVEIGRSWGRSTLALAAGLAYNDTGWQEIDHNKQRPDIDYPAFERPKKRKLYSIDVSPGNEARTLLTRAGVIQYVEILVDNSHKLDIGKLPKNVDILLVDGDHSIQGCRADIKRYVPLLRPGGYFILHDYFGWYHYDGTNQSPIKKVCNEIEDRYQHILIDTGYQSFMVFRNGI